MADVDVKTPAGAEAGTVELDDAIFGIEPNVPVMHQVVTAQLAANAVPARRAPRPAPRCAAVAPSPGSQKGTGRARAGLDPLAAAGVGGGVAHGPKPRSYAQRTPKKMIRLALRSALSDRAADGKVVVVDDWGFDAPEHQGRAWPLSAALGARGPRRSWCSAAASDDGAWKSFRNLAERPHLLDAGELNAYDVLVNDWVVFTQDHR